MNALTYLPALLMCTLAAHAQTPDSVRIEYSQGVLTPAPADTSARARLARERETVLLGKSRREITMIQIGLADPNLLFGLANPVQRRRNYLSGLWLGLNQKLAPDWGFRTGLSWRPAWGSRTANDAEVRSAGVQGMLAVDYYLRARREISEGRAANGFYLQPYLTLETWRTLRDQRVVERVTGAEYSALPFRQSLAVGYGVCSDRRRLFYYAAGLQLAYWFGRSPDVRHPIQPVFTFTTGLGF